MGKYLQLPNLQIARSLVDDAGFPTKDFTTFLNDTASAINALNGVTDNIAAAIVDVNNLPDAATTVAGYLTDENVTFAADVNGVVDPAILSAYSDTLKILDGSSDVSTGHGITYRVADTVNCSVAIDPTTGLITVSSIDADTASADFEADYNQLTIFKTWSASKARAGSDGSPAKTVILISDRQMISHNGSGTLTPTSQTITFTAQRQNTTATPVWSITDFAGATVSNSYLTIDTAGGSISATMTAANYDAARAGGKGLIVMVTITDGSPIYDKISITSVVDGATGANGGVGANGANGADGASAFTIVNVANTTLISPHSVSFNAGGGGSRWIAKARTVEAYPAGVTTGFMRVECMLGLTTDPTVDASYGSVDYALYRAASNVIGCWRNGTGIATVTDPFAGTTLAGPYTVARDGTNVRYFANGNLIPSFTHAVNGSSEQHYGVYVAGDTGSTIEGITFSAAGVAGATGPQGGPGLSAIGFYQDSPTPTATVLYQTWYRPSTKTWYSWNGSSWVPLLGIISSMDKIIDSAYIGNAVIVNAHIADLVVDNAKIANLTVGTSKISDGAVTGGGSGVSSTLIGLPAGSEVVVLSVTSTITSNNPVIVMGKFECDGGAYPVTMRLRRDGTIITTTIVNPGATVDLTSYSAFEAPGAGSHTYTLTGQIAGGPRSGSVTYRDMIIVEFKK